jgi:hypothetical protein
VFVSANGATLNSDLAIVCNVADAKLRYFPIEESLEMYSQSNLFTVAVFDCAREAIGAK